MNTDLKSLSNELNIPFRDKIKEVKRDSEIFLKIPLPFMKRYKFVPIEMKDNTLTLATAFPWEVNVFDELSQTLGIKIKLVFSPVEEIDRAIEEYLSTQHSTPKEMVEELKESELEIVSSEEEKTDDLLDLANKPPIIKLVNMIIVEAIKKRATDIHIQPFENSLKIRYRVDGILYEFFTLPQQHQSAIISRLKVMSKLDVAEHRLPQDGRTTIKIGNRLVDIRVSCIPTQWGERIVLRLLDKSSSFLNLSELGLSPSLLARTKRLINLPNGMLLVTGPTGSGKTTTLYAILNEINTPQKNIITIEDPIEYSVPGVSQIQVKPKINLTFASGLRSVLRQDPDIIMVGEIRDKETATIAIQAALTGHLVFSTLHTNDSPGAVTRLLDLGVEPYLISSSLMAVFAQRLVRLSCRHCLKPYTPQEEFLTLLKEKGNKLPPTLYKGYGCELCLNTGYRGRTGIFELLIISEEIREMVLARRRKGEIAQKAQDEGMVSLFQDGLNKVKQGITTLEEVVRVTYYEVS